MAERVCSWYQSLAEGLVNDGAVPEPLPPDPANKARIVEAVQRDLYDEGGHASGTGVRIIWTGDHLEAARRLQAPIAQAVGRAAQAGGSSSAASRRPRS